jgi:peptidoglycan hydrolase-like protein with peptidoglycan-binding domain
MKRFGGEPGEASGAGAAAPGHPAPRRPALRHPAAWVIVPAVAIVAVMGTAATYALAHATSGAGSQAGGTRRAALGSQAAGPARPLRVLSVSPASGARGVDGGNPVVLTFSAPLAAGSPMPGLKPAVRGSWQRAGASLAFRPAIPFAPSSQIALRIPAGAGGVRSAAGGTLARPFAASFRTMAWSTRRLGELLAQLHYLPLSWRPLSDGTAGGGADGAGLPGRAGVPDGAGPSGPGLAAQMAAAYSPPAGTFRWHRGYPASLRSQWRAGRPGLILKGAVMAFESQHGMALTGVAGPSVWTALFRAADGRRGNPDGYTYALASKGDPETLTIWHDGRIVLTSAANTGIPVAPTADGTFPVYLRYQFQIMRGINPDGSSYADPVSYVSYFDGGDAVHYFPRGSYGFPQSLGCVELPLAAAEAAWPYLTYGSLVTVAG